MDRFSKLRRKTCRHSVIWLITCPVVTTGFLLFSPSRMAQVPAWRAGHISSRLFDPRMNVYLQAMPYKMNIETTTVAVGPETSLDQILRENGVVPNADSYGLLYELNPTINNLGELKFSASRPAVNLTLPKIGGRAAFERLQKKGQLVEITTDQRLKQDLLDGIEKYKGFSASVNRSSTKQPEASAVSQRYQEIATYLATVETSIRQRARPLSTALLEQLQGQVTEVNDMLRRMMAPRQTWSRSDVATLTIMAQDISQPMATFNEAFDVGKPPKKWREAKVLARVLENGKDSEKQWRVFYCPRSLIKNSRYWKPFPRLIPERRANLAEANYYFWVAANENGTPPPNPFFQEIRMPDDNSLVVLELSAPDRR